MGCSQLCFKNFPSIRYRERLILYSLYPISGSCTFSKFIACCITCRRNGTGSLSLISLDVSFLNSKVILHHVASRGLVPSSLTGPFLVVRWDIWTLAHAIVISVFMLDAVILSLLTALFLYGSILFLFLLSIIAPGAVRFCILCNFPSSHPFYPPFPSSLPHLPFPRF